MSRGAAEVWRTHVSRFPITLTIVTLGALAVSAAVLAGAFAVIDQRAAQVLKEGPRAVPAAQKRAPSADASRGGGARQDHRVSSGSKTAPGAATNAQTVGSAAAASSVAAPQTMSGDTGDKRLRKETRHHATRHERWSARRHSQEQPSQQQALQQSPSQPPPAQPPPSQNGGRSAFFFPFR